MILRKPKFSLFKFLLTFSFIFIVFILAKFDSSLTRHFKSNLIKIERNESYDVSLEPIKNFEKITRANPILIYKQIKAIKNFYILLESSEKKYFSQNKEDGVLVKLAELINHTHNGNFVEIGTESGIQTNTRYLREKYGWRGLYLDNKFKDLNLNLQRENVTHQNVLGLLEKYNVNQSSLDLLSEDTDYADYWILEQILLKYKPKLIVHEINEQPPNICVTVLKPLSLTEWIWNSEYHGASLCAFQCLAKRFDYTIVYCESAGVNCFWMRNDLLYELFGIQVDIMRKELSTEFLWRKQNFAYHQETDKDWHHVNC